MGCGAGLPTRESAAADRTRGGCVFLVREWRVASERVPEAFHDLIGDEAIAGAARKAISLENATLYVLRECRDGLWQGVRSLFELTGRPSQRPWGMRPRLWKDRRYYGRYRDMTVDLDGQHDPNSGS
jgi:hypothetical protein